MEMLPEKRAPSSAEERADVLTLFRENIDQTDRIKLFEEAAEQLRADVDQISSPENVSAINEAFKIELVLNSHGTATHVAQSMDEVSEPFVSFTESTGFQDIHQEPVFAQSIDNAFDTRFNNAAAKKPDYSLNQNNAYYYWQQRALLAKGSIVAPIDLRAYSLRLLDALMGDDYSQEYLNRGVTKADFQVKQYDELLESTVNRGLLMMHSNAVRELSSTRQILETLLAIIDDEKAHGAFGQHLGDKVIALRNREKLEKLNVYIFYGTAHHGIVNEFRSRGVDVKRTFAESNLYPKPFKFVGTPNDYFFNGRHHDASQETLEGYAKEAILQSMFWHVIGDQETYAVTPLDDSPESYRSLNQAIFKLSRSKELQDKLPEIIEEYKTNPFVPLRILSESGLPLRYLDDSS